MTTNLDVHGDAWWPSKTQHQRWSMRMTPGIRIGLPTGFYGEFDPVLLQEVPELPHRHPPHRLGGGDLHRPLVGYNFGKLAQVAGGFTFDFTHYLDAHYNALAPDGTLIRSTESKNYLDYIPFGELQLRPAEGLRDPRALRLRAPEDPALRPGDDRTRRVCLTHPPLLPRLLRLPAPPGEPGALLDFRDRLHLAAMAEAWVRRFDVDQARTVDNFWTGELRLDTEIEASLDAAVRVHTIKGKYRQHDFFVTLLGSHVTRTSNMQREVSLATNFDITRVLLGFVVRGH